jgi:serine/threonine-protein kinase SRPK3
MKVLSTECYGASVDIFEFEIVQHLKAGDVNHPGYKHISILEEFFTHQGPNGSHICLVFKVMGESMSTFRELFDTMIPTPLVHRFTMQLLQALDFAYKRVVIHTGMLPYSPPTSKYIES